MIKSKKIKPMKDVKIQLVRVPMKDELSEFSDGVPMKDELSEFSDEMDQLFDRNDPAIAEKKFTQKLKIVGWVAFTISFMGILLNAYKIIWCWPVWCVANFFWIYWATKKKEWAQVWLWTTFTLANIFGWYMWFIT